MYLEMLLEVNLKASSKEIDMMMMSSQYWLVANDIYMYQEKTIFLVESSYSSVDL